MGAGSTKRRPGLSLRRAMAVRMNTQGPFGRDKPDPALPLDAAVARITAAIQRLSDDAIVQDYRRAEKAQLCVMQIDSLLAELVDLGEGLLNIEKKVAKGSADVLLLSTLAEIYERLNLPLHFLENAYRHARVAHCSTPSSRVMVSGRAARQRRSPLLRSGKDNDAR